MRITQVGKFHSDLCLVEYGIKRTDKLIEKSKQIKKQTHAKQKKKFYETDIKTRKKAARDVCHKYIRLRDQGEPCICCNRELTSGINAGHFLESGNNPRIRYDEDNIHAQSVYCNMYKGGDSGDYRKNLIKKIGIKRVERLDRLKGGTMKRTAQDYQDIEDYYKAKIKELVEQNN